MNKEFFVQNVKELCLKQGVKPTNACKESGVGGSFLSDISRGQTPSVAKVQMLAQYLGVTTSELLGEKVPDLAILQEIFKHYKVDGELPPDASPEAREAFRKLQVMDDLPGLVDEIDAKDQWEFMRLGQQALEAKAKREAEEKPTPVSGDGLSEEQMELLSRYDAASPALRAAALAVLKSGEEQGNTPGDTSTGK